MPKERNAGGEKVKFLIILDSKDYELARLLAAAKRTSLVGIIREALGEYMKKHVEELREALKRLEGYVEGG